jgi:23S rRNA (adenine2503-C2)-methyltransferase
MIPLQGMTPEGLVRALPGLTLVEARRVVSAVHREIPLDRPLKGVRKVSLALVRGQATVPSLSLVQELPSRLDPFVKLSLMASDGSVFETVRIPLEKRGRFTVCVSSQVGCALGCLFCATGRMGLARNLETWEIVEQVRMVKRTLHPERGEHIRGVVFQGMGEPLANLDRVLEAILVLTEPSALAIDTRAITVCTAGLPSGIVRLAREAPRVRLAWSIGSARAEVRRRLMPIDGSYPLGSVVDACVEHARLTGLAPMWAITPLARVNDTKADAAGLAKLASDFVCRTGLRPRISLIPYNRIDRDPTVDPFEPTSAEAEAVLRETLRDAGFGAHKRYSGGADIQAGCGQLVSSNSIGD